MKMLRPSKIWLVDIRSKTNSLCREVLRTLNDVSLIMVRIFDQINLGHVSARAFQFVRVWVWQVFDVNKSNMQMNMISKPRVNRCTEYVGTTLQILNVD